MNNPTGTLKDTLARLGVRFVKNERTQNWEASLDGQEIGRHKEQGQCVKQAAKALGEI
jgi:hypothetical protein